MGSRDLFFRIAHHHDTIDNIARYIGRDAAVIQTDLEDLVKPGCWSSIPAAR
jgi:hypothetical protein